MSTQKSFKINSRFINDENRLKFYYFLLTQPRVNKNQLKIDMYYYLINRENRNFIKVKFVGISGKEILAKNSMGALISISLSELREISDEFNPNNDYHPITRTAGGRKPRTHKRGRLHKNRSRRNK